MHALILAGGKGTRLRPLTVYTPKPVVPVVNKPFLLYQLEILARAKITNVTLSLSYQPNKIEDILGDGSDYGVKLQFVTEPNPLGTAGAYKFAASDVAETTVVLNGDILTDIDIAEVVRIHRERGATATLSLTEVEDPSKYGLVEMGPDQRVKRFIEKPKAGENKAAAANTINAGIYILEPSVLKLIPEGVNTSFEYDVFPALLAGDAAIFGHVMDGDYWRDIGTPESYLAANHDILAGKVGIESANSGKGSETSPTAFIDSLSVLGEGCVVKPNARISNSVLGPGVHVEEKAVIENSVIWPHCRISTFAEIDNAVIGRGSHIGRNARVRNGSVIGDKAMVPDYSVV